MNSVVLLGRITADPEVKSTQTGISVCRFSVAVDRSRTDANGQRQADFINCVAWRGQADFLGKYFKKGSPICLAGSIQTGKYQDRNGNTRTSFDVVVNDIRFVPGSKSGESRQSAYQAPGPEPVVYASGNNDDFIDVSMDDVEDLPF